MGDKNENLVGTKIDETESRIEDDSSGNNRKNGSIRQKFILI